MEGDRKKRRGNDCGDCNTLGERADDVERDGSR